MQFVASHVSLVWLSLPLQRFDDIHTVILSERLTTLLYSSSHIEFVLFLIKDVCTIFTIVSTSLAI